MIFPLPPFPKNIFSIIVGLALIGAGGPLIFILCLIELTKNVKKISINYDQNTINDIASAINNLFISIGDLIGPIVGGFLTSHFGFKACCSIIFIISFIFYLMFQCYYGKSDKNNNGNILRNDYNDNRALNEQLFK